MSFKDAARRVPGAAPAYRRLQAAWRYAAFVRDFRAFRKAAAASPARFRLAWRDRYPRLDDATATAGFDAHYVYHPAWAARILAETRPPVHVDISSSLAFCATVSAFVPVRFFEYRPSDLGLAGLSCAGADLTALPFGDGTIASLSCMHVAEHVGLGRYGDPLDPGGDLKAMRELSRVLAPGGTLLFVVPVGAPRVRFNAHRIYSWSQVVGSFPTLALREFSLVADPPNDRALIRNASEAQADAQEYGCGCFRFEKPRP